MPRSRTATNGEPRVGVQGGQRRAQLVLATLLLLVAVGALPAGVGMVLDPSGATVGLDVAMLSGTAFETFAIPGVVLLLANGVGSGVAAVANFRGWRSAAVVGAAFAIVLLGWMFVQLAMLGVVHWLQPTLVVVGLLELSLASYVLGPPSRPLRWTEALRRGAIGVASFVGVTAIAGAIELIVFPYGHRLLDTPVSALEGTGFASFTIPGVLLGVFVGIGSVAAAIASIRRARGSALAIAGAGVVTCAWIVAEMYLLRTHSAIELVYLALGLAMVLLGLEGWRRRASLLQGRTP